MNLESLMKSDFVVINLNESTPHKWCYHKVMITKDLKIEKRDIFKMYTIPEFINSVIIGFYYFGDADKVKEKIEALKIYHTTSKID